MPIFVKRVTRESHVDVAIEANTQYEANKIFDDWLYADDESNSEEFNSLMSERETDCENWLCSFNTIEEYNRSTHIADFLVTKLKSKKTPLYDLYFCYEDTPIHTLRKVWENITIADVLRHLQEVSKENYIIKPGIPKSAQMITDAKNRGVVLLVYNLVSNGGNN